MSERRSVREILVELKDTASYVVSLAYASLLSRDIELAREVIELENEVRDLRDNLFEAILLAARSARRRGEVRSLTTLLEVGYVSMQIANVAADIAKLAITGGPLPLYLVKALKEAEIVTGIATVSSRSKLVGRKISELFNPPVLSGCDILAIRRGRTWIFDYDADEVIEAGDQLLLKGTAKGVKEASAALGGEVVVQGPLGMVDVPVIRNILRRMKDTSESMIELAYTALIYDSIEIAREVIKLEEQMDRLYTQFEREVLRVAGADLASSLPPALRVAIASENIADAAASLAELVIDKVTAHPVLKLVFKEAEETAILARVRHGSYLDGKSITDSGVEEKSGMRVVAVKRGRRWAVNPPSNYVIRGGDLIVAVGMPEGAKVLLSMVEGRGSA
ncbi:MAG: hypothetical protein DRN99_00450 [Thermoproteota archaeon]|nr:MAG: hypothetical protein DRN99_00450 [Candidatus Korarchaeota archaeon]